MHTTEEGFPATPLTHYSGKAYRFVETQEYAATAGLVNNQAEQDVLETLLDEVKPRYRKGTESMHYLLKTPFRYPPLKYGSRFGSRQMPSFFYASETPHTALVEAAYYRFVFMHHTVPRYPNPVRSQHALFYVRVKSTQCSDLTQLAAAEVQRQLTHPSQYQYSQKIGQWLVSEQRTELIRYYSARHRHGVNLALAQPSVIRSNTPQQSDNWLCLTTPDTVSFSTPHQPSLVFEQSEFKVGGVLPSPAL